MTAILRQGKKWIVRDRTGEWQFDTHAEAQKKANDISTQKIREMSGEEIEDDPLREIEKRNASGFEAPLSREE